MVEIGHATLADAALALVGVGGWEFLLTSVDRSVLHARMEALVLLAWLLLVWLASELAVVDSGISEHVHVLFAIFSHFL